MRSIALVDDRLNVPSDGRFSEEFIGVGWGLGGLGRRFVAAGNVLAGALSSSMIEAS